MDNGAIQLLGPGPYDAVIAPDGLVTGGVDGFGGDFGDGREGSKGDADDLASFTLNWQTIFLRLIHHAIQQCRYSITFLPGKPATAGTARATVPAARRSGCAVAIVFGLARWADGPPWSSRHLDAFPIATLGACADLNTFRTPNGIVGLVRANQGMGDLVKEGVADFRFGVAFGKVSRELDSPTIAAMWIMANTRAANIAIQTELPVRQSVLLHQLTSQFSKLLRTLGQTKWPAFRHMEPELVAEKSNRPLTYTQKTPSAIARKEFVNRPVLSSVLSESSTGPSSFCRPPRPAAECRKPCPDHLRPIAP